MYPQFIGARVTHRRNLLRLDHFQADPAIDQPQHADRQVHRCRTFTDRQLDNALHQLQQLDAGIQPGLRGAVLDVEQIAQLQQGAVAGTQCQLAQVGHHVGGRAALLQYFHRRLQQLRSGSIGAEQLPIVTGLEVEVDGQLVQVAQHVELGAGNALPTGHIKLHVTAQGTKQGIEQRRLSRIDGGQGGSDTQHGLRWNRRRCHRMGVQGGGQRHPCALCQAIHPRRDAGGDRVAHIYPDRLGAVVVRGEGAQAVGAGLQVAAAGRQRVAGRMAVAGGRRPGNHRGLRPAAGANGILAGRLQRGHVGNALQLALLQVQPAAVDHQQHEQQRQAQGNHCHEADCATLAGSE